MDFTRPLQTPTKEIQCTAQLGLVRQKMVEGMSAFQHGLEERYGKGQFALRGSTKMIEVWADSAPTPAADVIQNQTMAHCGLGCCSLSTMGLHPSGGGARMDL